MPIYSVSWKKEVIWTVIGEDAESVRTAAGNLPLEDLSFGAEENIEISVAPLQAEINTEDIDAYVVDNQLRFPEDFL